MLTQFRRSNLSGVTLIELMIAIALMAILMLLAMPSYSVWLQNSRIRSVSESVLNGLQRARAEAVARNKNVAFVLGTNSGWTVTDIGSGAAIDSKSSGEGSQGVSVSILPANATTITFGSLGTVLSNANGSAAITQVDFDSSVLSAANSRKLRITVGVGGSVRMCDPNVSSATDPRLC